MRILCAAVAAATMLAGADASARELIRCQRPGAAEITIRLNDRTAFGRSLSCISGRFVVDLTPCAPENGFGLSAPTGSAALVGVANDWPQFVNHHGGVTRYAASAEDIEFSGGWFSLDRRYEEQWRFTINRATRQGSLSERGRTDVYTCK